MSDLPPAAQQLIDGKLVGASDGATYPILNPATGAGDRARRPTAPPRTSTRRSPRPGGPSTRPTGRPNVELRVRCLRQLHQALLDHAEEFRALTTAEVGMPGFMTGAAEFDVPVEGLKWVTDLLESYECETDLGVADADGHPDAAGPYAASRSAWSPRSRRGTCPTQINLAKVGPALAAGCTVVLKPAPDTPWVACELGRLVAEHTDIPAGRVQRRHPARPTRSPPLLTTDPRVDMVSFTGSTATGRAIMAAAAPTLKKVFLELGGKSAAIVLDDADVAAAAGATAFAACIHAGQGCAITTRLLVPREKYDEAVAGRRRDDGVDRRQGPGRPRRDLRPGDLAGPARPGRGATCGSPRRRAAPSPPAATSSTRTASGSSRPSIAGLDNSSRLAQEEIFGPVLVVIPHDGDDDAVRIANDSPYGLSGSVDSGDLERAKAVAARIRTGTIAVNGGVWFSPDAPFGGYKQSGIGREMGVAGFEEYLETKTVAEPA